MRRAEMSGGDWEDGAGYKPGGTENDDGDFKYDGVGEGLEANELTNSTTTLCAAASSTNRRVRWPLLLLLLLLHLRRRLLGIGAVAWLHADS